MATNSPPSLARLRPGNRIAFQVNISLLAILVGATAGLAGGFSTPVAIAVGVVVGLAVVVVSVGAATRLRRHLDEREPLGSQIPSNASFVADESDHSAGSASTGSR